LPDDSIGDRGLLGGWRAWRLPTLHQLGYIDAALNNFSLRPIAAALNVSPLASPRAVSGLAVSDRFF